MNKEFGLFLSLYWYCFELHSSRYGLKSRYEKEKKWIRIFLVIDVKSLNYNFDMKKIKIQLLQTRIFPQNEKSSLRHLFLIFFYYFVKLQRKSGLYYPIKVQMQKILEIWISSVILMKTDILKNFSRNWWISLFNQSNERIMKLMDQDFPRHFVVSISKR